MKIEVSSISFGTLAILGIADQDSSVCMPMTQYEIAEQMKIKSLIFYRFKQQHWFCELDCIALKSLFAVWREVVVMAFVNERLTSEQKEIFNSLKIKKPIFGFGRIIREVDMELPWYWTIDKERKMYLMSTSYDRDYPDERVFVFIWNNKNYLVQFNISVENGYTVVWNIPKHYLINEVYPYCKDNHFLDDLREALVAYGVTGNPNTSNKKCSTKCNF